MGDLIDKINVCQGSDATLDVVFFPKLNIEVVNFNFLDLDLDKQKNIVGFFTLDIVDLDLDLDLGQVLHLLI